MKGEGPIDLLTPKIGYFRFPPPRTGREANRRYDGRRRIEVDFRKRRVSA